MEFKWSEVSLGEFADINPRRTIAKGIPAKFIEMAALPTHARDIEIKDIALREFTSGGAKFKNGDTLLARITPCLENGKTALVSCLSEQELAFGSTEFIVLGPKCTDDSLFLYYLARSDDFRSYAIARMEGTSGRQRVPNSAVADYRFQCPPINLRREIGKVLGALDDRIALLRETNATLEAMTHALFKSWFVDFDPVHANTGTRAATLPAELQALFPSTFTDTPQGPVPEGWRLVSFTETINVIGGGTPKTSIPEYWGGDIPWFSVVDAPATTDVFVISTEKQITELGLNNSSTKLLPAGTTIISARGTVGRLALVGCDMAMNQSCYGLRGKYKDDYFTYFTTCRLVEALKQRSHGSVFDTITRDTLAGVSVIYPDYSVVSAFEDTASAVMEKIKNNLQQAQTLAALRDTLLPRLISGQLRLPDAAAALAEVGA
jgi:type I restriction enzyme S subunit